MFFIGCIRNCFGFNETRNEQKRSLTIISKLIIKDNESKLPIPSDKEGFNELLKKLNITSSTILGGRIEFVLMNPSEEASKNSRYIRYIVNMRNVKTLLITNTFYFINHIDQDEQPVLYIFPYQNDTISFNEWNFIESAFYNMRYKINKVNKHI